MITNPDQKVDPEKLIEFWNELDTEKEPPYIHPKDKFFNDNEDQFYKHKYYDAFINDKEFGHKNNKFHLGLLPSPYGGDIENAEIYILMLNPGFSKIDYKTQELFFDDIKNELRQNRNKLDYPFMFLDPKCLWTGGGAWCERKLRDIVELFMDIFKLSYRDALKELSKRIAMIELFPYHSASFDLPKGAKLDKIPSVEMIKKFVKDYVIEKAKRKDAVVVVTRSVKMWFEEKDIEDYKKNYHDNIVIYPANLARSASLSEGSEGYKKIEKFSEKK